MKCGGFETITPSRVATPDFTFSQPGLTGDPDQSPAIFHFAILFPDHMLRVIDPL